MRIRPEQPFKPFVLTDIDNQQLDLSQLQGRRFMLSFFRFASCPFCNMRMHKLVKNFDDIKGNSDFTIIAVFDSPLDNLQEHSTGHHAPFSILADPENIAYKLYGIEHSWIGVLKGLATRLPTLIKGITKGYVPLKFKGRIDTMPADFLIDEQGMIQEVYYGKDEGDHMPIEQIKAFAYSEFSDLRQQA